MRLSTLEGQVLDGKAALASAQAERDAMVSEVAAAREAGDQFRKLETAMIESSAREDAVRAKLGSSNDALKVRNERYGSLCFLLQMV